MKTIKLLLVMVAFTLPIVSFSQVQNRNGKNYEQPVQVDSTDYYLIPKLVDKTNRAKYGSGNNYYNGYGVVTDLYMYNSKTKSSKSLFGNKFCLISPIGYSYYRNYYGNTNAGTAILKNEILVSAKTTDINNDGIMDDDDPTYIYMTDLKGENLRQITPDNMTVISWSLSTDDKTILVILKKDTTGNKNCEDEDELLYQINLDKDISKITIAPVELK